MAFTTATLVVLVLLGLALAVYNEWLIKLRYAPIEFLIVLHRSPRKDYCIVTALLLIVFVQQQSNDSNPLTGLLLVMLILLSGWFAWLRQPVALIKTQGIVTQGRFILWSQVNHYQLTQDGMLVLGLANEQIFLRVKRAEDLQRLYQHIIMQPS